MKILPYGEKAVVVNFEQKIAPSIHAKVVALKKAMEQAPKGIDYCIPAYCSLTIVYDPLQWTFAELSKYIEFLLVLSSNLDEDPAGRQLNIPICYDDELALDMEDVMAFSGLSRAAVIRAHCAVDYRVYMLGFLPGFAYMGRLAKVLECPRKAHPRRSVPAGSLGLAGQQTGIYPVHSPGGWHIIGQTPLAVFDHRATSPFLFQVGDIVRFYAINAKEFNNIQRAVEKNIFDKTELYRG